MPVCADENVVPYQCAQAAGQREGTAKLCVGIASLRKRPLCLSQHARNTTLSADFFPKAPQQNYAIVSPTFIITIGFAVVCRGLTNLLSDGKCLSFSTALNGTA